MENKNEAVDLAVGSGAKASICSCCGEGIAEIGCDYSADGYNRAYGGKSSAGASDIICRDCADGYITCQSCRGTIAAFSEDGRAGLRCPVCGTAFPDDARWLEYPADFPVKVQLDIVGYDDGEVISGYGRQMMYGDAVRVLDNGSGAIDWALRDSEGSPNYDMACLGCMRRYNPKKETAALRLGLGRPFCDDCASSAMANTKTTGAA